jgi:RND family efflux transporter MFP subunit
LIIVILAVGGFAARWLLRHRPQIKRQPPREMVTLVRARALKPEDCSVVIEAQGRVVPAREIVLQARVSGRVVAVHPHLVPGGRIAKGELLLRLDDTDYRLNLQRLEDALALEEADLRLEEGNQTVARQEWELVRKLTPETEFDTSSRDLALRQPQLAKIRARIKSARTALERARVDLERCVLRAPFDLVVRSENVDIGSEITTATKIATLAASDLFWAEISVPVKRLRWFSLPAAGRPGARVELRTRIDPENGAGRPWSGRIVSLAPDLDPNGLMARLLVAIEKPLARRPPLLLGSFVRARIFGRRLQGVFRLPRSCLQEKETLFLVDADRRLARRRVHVVWKDREQVFIDRGLAPGERVVISKIAAPVSGMRLKVISADGSAAAKPAAAAYKSAEERR